MKKIAGLCILILIAFSCHKDKSPKIAAGCDIQQVYIENAAKVTITDGIWGTLSSIEGDCMPVVQPGVSSCKNCPVKRTVRIYEYALLNNATPSGTSTTFFDSFNTPLVAEVETDDNGFFQVSIPPGHYSVAIVEDGKLYVNGMDGQGGLCPFILPNGLLKFNLAMTYKAVF
jgi:hypothetical protein